MEMRGSIQDYYYSKHNAEIEAALTPKKTILVSNMFTKKST